MSRNDSVFQHLLCKYIQWRYLFVSQSILITLESESWIWKMLEMSSLLKGDAFQFKRLQKVFVPLHWLEDHLSWIFNRLFGSKMTGNFSRLAFVVMSLRLLFYLCVAYKLPSVRCISGVVHTSLKAGKWPDFSALYTRNSLLPFLKFLSVAMTHILLSRHQESWTQCEKLWSRRYFNGWPPHRYQYTFLYIHPPQ